MKVSSRFEAAAKAEIRRLEGQLARIVAQQQAALAHASEKQREAEAVEERIAALQQAAGLPSEPRPVREVMPSRPGVGGRDLRFALVRVVAAGERLHYTSWHERMKRAGTPVGGQDPEATLLTALSRHPLVRAVGMRTGDYIADPELVEEWEAKVEALEAEVAEDGVKRRDYAKVRELMVMRERLLEARTARDALGTLIPT